MRPPIRDDVDDVDDVGGLRESDELGELGELGTLSTLGKSVGRRGGHRCYNFATPRAIMVTMAKKATVASTNSTSATIRLLTRQGTGTRDHFGVVASV
ncbi:hypothetical protein [Embleya sp. AB8]|uniref:hypothetical protein n=1 Tax=Embleya sp. AB8 TaxID=3156304 RepID=UPI003C7910FF